MQRRLTSSDPAGGWRRLADSLTRTFVPDRSAGRAQDRVELGTRRTLRTLPMIYSRGYVAGDPEVRSALLQHVGPFVPATSEYSMRRLA